jgi:hypothetical protein
MKLESDAALSLIRALSCCPGYPYHSEAEGRMAGVLMECTVNVEHARAVINRFEEDCPTLQEIRTAAFDLREKFVNAPDAKPVCSTCRGTGWIVSEVTPKGSVIPVTGVIRCTCVAGVAARRA